MKKKIALSLLGCLCLSGVVMTACTSNSSSTPTSAEVQAADSVKTVGFVELANENTERIWFRFSGKITKDSWIDGIYVTKNGKVTYYNLASYYAGNSDFININETNKFKFSDIEKLSNKEIIEKAKELDKEALESYYEAQESSIESDLVEWPKDDEYRLYLSNLQQYQEKLQQYKKENDYESYRKRVTDQKVTATVRTDDTGNAVDSEGIELQTFDEFEPVGVMQVDGDSVSIEKHSTLELYWDLSDFTRYTVYDSLYFSVDDALATRDMPKNTVLGFDNLQTKNVTEGE